MKDVMKVLHQTRDFLTARGDDDNDDDHHDHHLHHHDDGDACDDASDAGEGRWEMLKALALLAVVVKLVVEQVGGQSGADCCSCIDGGDGFTAITGGMLDMLAAKRMSAKNRSCCKLQLMHLDSAKPGNRSLSHEKVWPSKPQMKETPPGCSKPARQAPSQRRSIPSKTEDCRLQGLGFIAGRGPGPCTEKLKLKILHYTPISTERGSYSNKLDLPINSKLALRAWHPWWWRWW